MRERIIRRYSECFKRQVVSDLESGRFASVGQARAHYEIKGSTTVNTWLSRYGQGHLRAKVVRVEKPDEADRVRELQGQVAALQRALGQTQAENLLNAEYLKLACVRLGEAPEAFKKKCVGRPSTGPTDTAC
ncbi:MAG: transposase [Phycisphaerae bacterium]